MKSADAFAVQDVDVRGFAYALDPLCVRTQWRVDRLLAELALARQALAKTDAEIDRLRKRHDLRAQAIGEANSQRLDPVAHRGSLIYLARLHERWRMLGRQREAQAAHRDRLREACAAGQLRLDGLRNHKRDALTRYADEIRRRQSAEQDRDWLSRMAAAMPSRRSEAAVRGADPVP